MRRASCARPRARGGIRLFLRGRGTGACGLSRLLAVRRARLAWRMRMRCRALTFMPTSCPSGALTVGARAGLSASDAALSGGPDGLDLSRCELCDAVSGGGAALAKVVVTLRAASRCDAQGRELRRGPRRRTARARPPRLRTPSRRPQRQLRRSDRSSRRLRVRLQRRVRTVFRRRERARALMHRRTCDLSAVSGGQRPLHAAPAHCRHERSVSMSFVRPWTSAITSASSGAGRCRRAATIDARAPAPMAPPHCGPTWRPSTRMRSIRTTSSALL